MSGIKKIKCENCGKIFQRPVNSRAKDKLCGAECRSKHKNVVNRPKKIIKKQANKTKPIKVKNIEEVKKKCSSFCNKSKG